jgi:hypothetical protein
MLGPVEHEACAACGFDGSRFDDDALVEAVRGLGPAWGASLTRAGDELWIRPGPGVWSALEYAAHTRDILALHVFGVDQALTLDEPEFGDIDADALIDGAAATYADADPDEVAADIAHQADTLADQGANASPADWRRGLTIGSHRSDVRRLLEHALHDATHHLADVDQGLSRIRAAGRPGG